MLKNKIIVICGIQRSGTTILGKLVGTLKDMEFFNEPKTIDVLLSLIDEIDEKYWKAIFTRNLYDDLLINTLSGRIMNTNKYDDSSIYNNKSKEEINYRLSKSFRQMDIEPIARQSIIGFKLSNNALFVNKAQKYIPGLMPLFIFRNPNDTLNSLSKKGWYKNEALSITAPKPASLFVTYKGLRIPNYVTRNEFDHWITLTEIEKYAYYYRHMLVNMRIYKGGENLFINYDNLIKNSGEGLEKILTHYQLDKTKKTKKILASIKYQPKKRENILDKLSKKTREELINLYQEYVVLSKL